MIQPVSVQPRSGYRIWIEFSNGVAGEIDLSDLAGQGVFQAWNDLGYFGKVYIAPTGAIAWGDEIDLCPESLYIDLTGKSVEEVLPGVRFTVQDA